MQPLLFLATRSVINGLKRSLTSGKRIISLIFVIGYYLLVFARPLFFSNSGAIPRGTPMGAVAEMPKLVYIDSGVFAVFAVITSLLMLTSTSMRSGFRKADVDVLFPTPVSAWNVMLFRLLIEYASTLLLPLLLAVVGFRAVRTGLDAFIQNFPEHAGLAFRMLTISWLLLSAFWVCANLAFGLWIDRQPPKTRAITFWSVGIGAAILAGFLAFNFSGVTTFDQASRVLQSPVLRVIFFSATAATAMVMGPIYTNWSLLAAGLGGIFVGIGTMLYLCRKQIDYLYDINVGRVAARGDAREQMRKGDMTAYRVQQAQQGKIKARKMWFSQLRFTGPMALLWKNLLIQWRTSALSFLIILMAAVFVSVMIVTIPNKGAGPVGLFTTSMIVFGFSMGSAQIFAIELLKRVDFHKPLPYTSQQHALVDIFAGGIMGIASTIVPMLVAMVAKPSEWGWWLAGLIALPTVCLLISAVSYTIMMIFPDYDDPTQKGFRGMMSLLGLLVVTSPGVGLMFLCVAFLRMPVAGAVLWSVVNIALVMVLTLISGKFYEGFNPSE